VEDDAADELDVEVAHADGALAGFANDGEGFGKDGVECGLFGGVEGVFVGLFLFGRIANRGTFAAAMESAMRWRNSAVFSRSCSSVSAEISGSRALICETRGIMRFTARSLLVPKTFAITELIKTRVPSGAIASIY